MRTRTFRINFYRFLFQALWSDSPTTGPASTNMVRSLSRNLIPQFMAYYNGPFMVQAWCLMMSFMRPLKWRKPFAACPGRSRMRGTSESWGPSSSLAKRRSCQGRSGLNMRMYDQSFPWNLQWSKISLLIVDVHPTFVQDVRYLKPYLEEVERENKEKKSWAVWEESQVCVIDMFTPCLALVKKK